MPDSGTQLWTVSPYIEVDSVPRIVELNGVWKVSSYLLLSSASFQVTGCPGFHGTASVTRHRVQGPFKSYPIVLTMGTNS